MIKDTLTGLAYMLGVIAAVGALTFVLNHVCKNYPILLLPIAVFVIILPMSWQLGVIIREIRERKNSTRLPK
jgi:hypothetical protein